MATIGTTRGYASSAAESYKRSSANASDAKGKKGYAKKMATTASKAYERKGDSEMRAAGRSFKRKLTQSMKRTTR